MQKYRILKSLGQGAYGTVLKAQIIQTGQQVAIKKIKEKKTDWQECVNLRQVKSLSKLNNHQNIIKLKQVIRVDNQLHLVFEYLKTNIYQLYSALKAKGKRLQQSTIRSIIYQCIQGLAYIHKNGFFHRDMKPQNILITDCLVKIIDFGLARQIRSRPPYTDYVSTRWYRAPQLVLRSQNYNSPVDIFAIGCIMAQLYMNQPIFPGQQNDQLHKIMKVLGTPSKQQWPQGYKMASKQGIHFPQCQKEDLHIKIPNASKDAIDLLNQLLQFAARKRPTASMVLNHPYFAGISLQSQYIKVSQQISKIKQKDRILRKQKRQMQMRQTRKQKFLNSKKAQDVWLHKDDRQRVSKQKVVRQYKQLKKSQMATQNKQQDVQDIIKQLKMKSKFKQQNKPSNKMQTQSSSYQPRSKHGVDKIIEKTDKIYSVQKYIEPKNKQHQQKSGMPPLQDLNRINLNYNFTPYKAKNDKSKEVKLKRNLGLVGDRYVHSLQRPVMGLGGIGINIMKSGYKKQRDFQMPPILNKYKNLF